MAAMKRKALEVCKTEKKANNADLIERSNAMAAAGPAIHCSKRPATHSPTLEWQRHPPDALSPICARPAAAGELPPEYAAWVDAKNGVGAKKKKSKKRKKDDSSSSDSDSESGSSSSRKKTKKSGKEKKRKKESKKKSKK